MTSNAAGVATVLGAFSGLVAMLGVQARAWRGAGQRPCPGRARREAAAEATQVVQDESTPAVAGTGAAIGAQRGVPARNR